MRHAIDPLEPLRSVWRHRDLVWQMTERDARSRYRGSAGGLAWVAVQPILMLTVYTLFFTALVPSRWPGADAGPAQFALTLFVGLLLHGLLAEMFTRAPALVTGNPNLVKKVLFPLEVLPVIALGSALFHLAIGVAIWVVFHLVLRGAPPATALLLPLCVLPLAVMLLGFAWGLASLGVYVRDVTHVVPVLSSVLLFASPVFYPLAATKGVLHTLVLASPLTVPIEQSRRVLLEGSAPDAGALAAYSLVAVAVASLGFLWFQGTRRGFADVV